VSFYKTQAEGGRRRRDIPRNAGQYRKYIFADDRDTEYKPFAPIQYWLVGHSHYLMTPTNIKKVSVLQQLFHSCFWGKFEAAAGGGNDGGRANCFFIVNPGKYMPY